MSARGIHTWSGTATSRWPWILLAVCVAVPVVLAFVSSPWWLLLVVVYVPLIGFTTVTATVDLDGLSTTFGPWKWPTKRIRLDDIAAADAIELAPMKWGGWGYRWMPGRTATVIRKGPAIRVEKTNGKTYAVTVDEATYGAEVLKTLLSHQPPAD